LYVVEHLEQGLEEWCRLEYQHICKIVPPERLLFLRFPSGHDPADLAPQGQAPPRTSSAALEQLRPDLTVEARPMDVEVPPGQERAPACVLPAWDRICLLDMDAEQALEPHDAANFDALVFGGILGNVITQEDGSYSSDDRTSEIRKLGFVQRRHLGPMQMTTDTAVLVSSLVLEDARPLVEIPFVDSPEISGGDGGDEAKASNSGLSDCVCMEGFRYVAQRRADGEWGPILPDGMADHLVSTADGGILDSL